MEKTFTKKVKEEINKHIDKTEKVDFAKFTSDKVIAKKKLRIKFVKHGTIYDPSQSHHLEYNFNSPDIANITIKELSLCGIVGKLSVNNQNRFIVYIVDANTIMEFLKLLGAIVSYKEYKKIVEYKDKAKKTNRQVNFEIANIKKTANAVLTQIEDINKLLKIKKLENLDENLQSLIKARKKYDTLSLSELAEKMHVSKSALNHRFIKIRKILKEYT